MNRHSKPALSMGALVILLAACTSPNGAPLARVPTARGLLNGILGSQGPAETSTAGPKTSDLNALEAALHTSLQGTDVQIVNSNRQLRITLPAASSFDPGSAELRTSAPKELSALADNLVAFPKTRIDIVGHTDNTGPAARNMALSIARARTVMAYLAQIGVASIRMSASGRGEEVPVASNLTAAGRAKNERIEITIRAGSAG